MSELPFYFHAPTPRFFRDSGLFKNPKNKAFVDWCFERCSNEERIIFHDNKKITLKPYQFIFGRSSCSEATGLTENEVRTQQQRWENYGYLKKTTNKTTNRFTIYEWVLTCFLKNDNQQNNHQTTNSPPTHHHNQDSKIDRSKESHHPYPSSKISPIGLTDDFSLDLEPVGHQESHHNLDYQTQHKLDYQISPKLVIDNQQIAKKPSKLDQPSKLVEKIEVIPGVFLTQPDLDQCISLKGSLESVQYAIGYVMRSPGRKCKIYNWPNTLAKWDIKTDIKPHLQENEEMAKRYEKEYGEYTQGWSCRIYQDKKKDQRGLLFEPQSVFQESFFIPLIDKEFKEKASKFLRDKKMQKGRIS